MDELDLLAIHAFYALSYEIHRRKTFWIDESLAFMLAHTRLDVRGDGLRLPFARAARDAAGLRRPTTRRSAQRPSSWFAALDRRRDLA